MKSFEEQKQAGYPKSFIQTRSRRKKSLRLEDTQINVNNGVVLDSIYSTQDIDQEIKMNDEDLYTLLDEFSKFISDINLSDVEIASSKNLSAEPQPEKYLKKRSNEMLKKDENNEYRPRRSTRIKEMQIKKIKRNKRRQKEVKKQNNELGVIDEENLIESESKNVPRIPSQENLNMNHNENVTELNESIKVANLKQNKNLKGSNDQKPANNENSKLNQTSTQIKTKENQSQGNYKLH